jgi:hypothetical protein
MVPYRPTSVLVIAILQIVFGGLSLFCSAGGTLLDAVDLAPRKAQEASPPRNAHDKMFREMTKRAEDRLPYNKLKGKLYQGFGIVLSLLMIVGGIGLVLMARWGWWLTISYASLSLLVNCLNIGYEELIKAPIHREVASQLTATTDEEQLALCIINTVSYVSPCMGLLFLLYPLVVFVFLVLPGVRSAFRGEHPPMADPLQPGWVAPP